MSERYFILEEGTADEPPVMRRLDDGRVSFDVLGCLLQMEARELAMLFRSRTEDGAVDAADLRRFLLSGIECRSGAVFDVVRRWESATRPRRAIPDAVRVAVLRRDGRVCQYCAKSIGPRGKLHLDHVVPVSKGGENIEDNLVVACPGCNMSKGDNVGWRDVCGHLRWDTYSDCPQCRRDRRAHDLAERREVQDVAERAS